MKPGGPDDILSRAKEELLEMVPAAVQVLRDGLAGGPIPRNIQTRYRMATAVLDRVGLPAVSRQVLSGDPEAPLQIAVATAAETLRRIRLEREQALLPSAGEDTEND